MARKAYSEKAREQVRTALLTTVIQCIVDRGLIHSSIDALCKKVGISKTFFLYLFPFQGRTGIGGTSVSAAQAAAICSAADGRSCTQLEGERPNFFGDLRLR